MKYGTILLFGTAILYMSISQHKYNVYYQNLGLSNYSRKNSS